METSGAIFHIIICNVFTPLFDKYIRQLVKNELFLAAYAFSNSQKYPQGQRTKHISNLVRNGIIICYTFDHIGTLKFVNTPTLIFLGRNYIFGTLLVETIESNIPKTIFSAHFI